MLSTSTVAAAAAAAAAATVAAAPPLSKATTLTTTTTTTTMTMLRVATRALVAAVLALALRQVYVWKWYLAKMRTTGLPIVELDYPWLSMLGTVPTALREWARIYDYKLLNMRDLKASTVVVPTSVWNPLPVINSADPAVVKHILKDAFPTYVKPDVLNTSLRTILGHGIFAINHGPHAEDGGKLWTLQRKTASKIFTRTQFRENMTRVFAKHCLVLEEVLRAKLSGGAVVDMQTLMFRFTLDSIGNIGFGVELDTLRKEELPFATSFDAAQKIAALRFTKPFWNSVVGQLLYPSEREMARHVTVLNAFASDVISKRRAEFEREKSAAQQQQESNSSKHENILSLFMAENLGLDDKMLSDIVMSFLIAGRDTTACTLSFALLNLSRNPAIQDQLRAEIRARVPVSGPNNARFVRHEDLAQLPTLYGCVMETLRLFPPVPTDIKQAAEDDVLPGGFHVPKGTRITFEPYVMGHNPDVWPEPEAFKPERWVNAHDRTLVVPNPFEFPVFQAGPRVCLGQEMAKFEASLALAFLVDKFSFALADPSVVPSYAPGLTLTVRGSLDLRVTALSS